MKTLLIFKSTREVMRSQLSVELRIKLSRDFCKPLHPLESHVMSALAAGVLIIGNQLATIDSDLAERFLGKIVKNPRRPITLGKISSETI